MNARSYLETSFLILHLGAGFALADGIQSSGDLADVLSEALDILEDASY
jgi:hypothetical protein